MKLESSRSNYFKRVSFQGWRMFIIVCVCLYMPLYESVGLQPIIHMDFCSIIGLETFLHQSHSEFGRPVCAVVSLLLFCWCDAGTDRVPLNEWLEEFFFVTCQGHNAYFSLFLPRPWKEVYSSRCPRKAK
ncbi:hypothetical protein B0O99DRAFT_124038 [Bisporella sp. PMI_857]|nr:hypothetical protein B0O99DRAFT_124038 [Bisporella sp. PMI_857]